MKQLAWGLLLSATAFLFLGMPSDAAQKSKPNANRKKQAFTDAASAGADFAVQGEYTGELGGPDDKQTWGVQVIARGDGKFDGVAYLGGLPGDGWDGSEKIPVQGETVGAVTKLTSEKGSATIEDGVMTVVSSEGNQVGTLKRTIRKSPTLGKKPPKGAVVLFDGTSADNFRGGRLTDDGLLMEGVTSKQTFGSFRLHLEFRLPFMPFARGQGRGNSGCYLQGRYEVQILDSFGLEGKNNEAGGIYTISNPRVNLCYPPLSWQTYDITYTAAKFDDSGKKTADARITVEHNGVVVQDDVKLTHSTTASPLKEGPENGPIYLQNHGNPVRFRNIWLVPTDGNAQ